MYALKLIPAVLVASIAIAQPDRPRVDAAADSPQSFQRIYREALKAQDQDALRAMFLIRTPGERALVDVLIQNELDVAKLTAAAERAFGVKLVGGGTLQPPIESDEWKIENDLANIPFRNEKRNRFCATLRKVDGTYRIDLRAWGLNWMDTPEADESLRLMRGDPTAIERKVKALEEGRYRTIDEFRSVVGSETYLKTAPGSPIGNPPRDFRRPVKLDLSTPQAARRTYLIAMAEGDGQAFLQCQQIVNPADEPGLKVYARHISAFASLEEAACKKFDTRGRWFGVPAPLPNPRSDALAGLAHLDEPEFYAQSMVIRGDEAEWKDGDDIIAEFERINGQWKIRSRLKSNVGEKDEDPNDWIMIYTTLAQIEEDFARRIAGGEFATIEQAQEAIERAAQAPPPVQPPTTRP